MLSVQIIMTFKIMLYNKVIFQSHSLLLGVTPFVPCVPVPALPLVNVAEAAVVSGA